MKTINLNGTDYTIEQLTTILENAKQQNPMDKLYAYHNTTKEQFDKDYATISPWLKAQQIEAMIVEMYNKKVKADFNNHDQKKHILWWYLGDDFRLSDVGCCVSSSYVPSRLCFLREEDALEASKLYFEQFKNSRNE